ncbi:glycoside hydrolase family 3 C-terminal domain-containing protein [Carboxylicivirga sediminis]|uniref:Glycoside hydrolase family 3 C-terminal domain-containing protein n=1 Tax=Carboxylicivirga sediminis TaxID=2006564 RepID=A0A941EZH3_9BACT|nr:glycoside hydrolase family 3 C-terminal domain-containing protein [Carboxylicivirga sediminis]MBR8534017.1 glycoside hydrolase family 3 C-terminal domain-containing protein [Carboxylicivirga sediminis]
MISKNCFHVCLKTSSLILRHICIFLLFLLFSFTSHAQKQKWLDTSYSFNERADFLVEAMTLDEKISQIVDATPAIPRLGVQEYNWWNEALHGVARNGKATIFPQGIAMGASFNTELVQKVAEAISDEARAKFLISQSIGNYGKYAGLTFWTPNVNIFRDPRWGRGQETYGEDPYLMSEIGVAFVNGLQGNHPKYLKTAACAKHYAVHSGPEPLRHHFDVSPSKKDLYETYLPAFEALVTRGNVEGVMGAYNAIYGQPACSNEFLIKDILKKEWGFNGYIVSDCGAIADIHNGHQYTNNITESAALALNTGINLNCGYAYSHIKQAIEEGLTTEDVLDQRLKELLLTRFKLGLFDPIEMNPHNQLSPDIINCQKHIQLAKQMALESIVLLKNDNSVLPLDKNIKTPYVTGPFAASTDVLFANYYGISSNMVTILEGIANKVSLGTSLNYRMGALPFQKNLNPKNWAPHVAATADATIAVVGISADMEGEEVDAIASPSQGDRVNLKLPQNQINYVKEIADKKTGPLILVVCSGSAVALHELYDLCDAILYVWYPGEQGGNAVADIIFGDVSPSGHLPITIPQSVEQLPPFEDYSMHERTYKYMTETPLFPFGFGLSYTQFEFNDIKVNKTILRKKDNVTVSCQLTNTGQMQADAVAQLYLVPEDDEVETPQYILKRFIRMKLGKGKSQKVEFTLSPDDLMLFDEEGDKRWKKGNYKLVIGNALPSERSLELGAPKPVHASIELH